jgi:hypothetical protein
VENYYRKQAAECAREAASTSLAQVRERNLRAEQVWFGLADKEAQAADYRLQRTTSR